MFERLNTPQEAYHFKLGSALKMEDTVVEILQASIDSAQDPSVKALFQDHLDQSPHQRENLEQVFAAFGWEVDDSPCPAIQAIEKEGKANAKKTDDVLVDSVLLQGAVETEHHEIGVYENLIINARAMGKRPGRRAARGQSPSGAGHPREGQDRPGERRRGHPEAARLTHSAEIGPRRYAAACSAQSRYRRQ